MSLLQLNNPILDVNPVLGVPTKNTAGQKQLQYIFPLEGNGPFGYQVNGTQRQANFNVGSANSAWLPHESYFECSIAMGTTGCIPGDVNAIVDRFRLQTQSGLTIVDTNSGGANLWGYIQDVVTVSAQNKAQRWESNLQDLGTADASQVIFNSTPVVECFKLRIPFLQQTQAICLPVTGQLRMIIDFANDYIVCNQLSTAGGAGVDGYKITNLKYNVVYLPYAHEYLNLVKELAREGALLYPFSGVYYLSQPCTASSNTISIQQSFKYLKAFVSVQRLTADLATVNKNNLSKYQVPQGGLTALQVQQGSNNFPWQQIDTIPRQYVEMSKLFKVYNDLDSGNEINRLRYSTQADVTGANQGSTGPLNIVGIDMSSANGAMFSGISTVNGAVVYRFVSVSANTGQQSDMFLVYDGVFKAVDPTTAELIA